LTREWKQIGSPSRGKSTGKALNVSTPGSAYFPFKCNHCDKAGHKAQNCPDRLAGRPKEKKRGGGRVGSKPSSNQGNSLSGNKPKKDLSHIKCHNCNERGHYKNKCPKLKQETANNVEVALMVKVVEYSGNDGFGSVATTTECGHGDETDPLYCISCADSEDSVHACNVESLSVNIESDSKIESPEQAVSTSKHSPSMS
jgi:Zinc knuckle